MAGRSRRGMARQRFQGRVGDVPGSGRGGRAVRARLRGGRQGGAAGGAGARVVGTAWLGRCSGAGRLPRRGRREVMPPTLRLPRPDGTLEPYVMREAVAWPAPAGPIHSRVAYAAAHVVCDPLADSDPLSQPRLDWEATLSYRRYLWSLGLAVAEAMDTAQRGMGLGWPAARELIRRSVGEARATGGMIACGAGTDHLMPGERVTLDDVAHAYEEQVGYVERHGGRGILMASRAVTRAARGPDDYPRGDETILPPAGPPGLLHWLGDKFGPEPAGHLGT